VVRCVKPRFHSASRTQQGGFDAAVTHYANRRIHSIWSCRVRLPLGATSRLEGSCAAVATSGRIGGDGMGIRRVSEDSSEVAKNIFLVSICITGNLINF